jgi:hypothetical protein
MKKGALTGDELLRSIRDLVKAAGVELERAR